MITRSMSTIITTMTASAAAATIMTMRSMSTIITTMTTSAAVATIMTMRSMSTIITIMSTSITTMKMVYAAVDIITTRMSTAIIITITQMKYLHPGAARHRGSTRRMSLRRF